MCIRGFALPFRRSSNDAFSNAALIGSNHCHLRASFLVSTAARSGANQLLAGHIRGVSVRLNGHHILRKSSLSGSIA